MEVSELMCQTALRPHNQMSGWWGNCHRSVTLGLYGCLAWHKLPSSFDRTFKSWRFVTTRRKQGLARLYMHYRNSNFERRNGAGGIWWTRALSLSSLWLVICRRAPDTAAVALKTNVVTEERGGPERSINNGNYAWRAHWRLTSGAGSHGCITVTRTLGNTGDWVESRWDFGWIEKSVSEWASEKERERERKKTSDREERQGRDTGKANVCYGCWVLSAAVSFTGTSKHNWVLSPQSTAEEQRGERDSHLICFEYLMTVLLLLCFFGC